MFRRFCIVISLLFVSLPSQALVDDKAIPEVKELHQYLTDIAPKHVLVGQQDATAYGIGWFGKQYFDQYDKSDMKDVVGSHPALYGWDMEGVGGGKQAYPEAYGKNRERLKRLIKTAYVRGGINTVSWHMHNPKTLGKYTDTTRVVSDILPGGSLHEDYKKILDAAAKFFNDLKGIPLIFRPFHEHNGGWFWWGKGHCSEAEYIQLWQFTIEYLRDVKDVHNLLYAFSPDAQFINKKEDYLYRYPGDDYVDILGLDNYQDVKKAETRGAYIKKLEYLTQAARQKGKIAALTETGLNTINVDEWFYHFFLTIQYDFYAKNIAYVMLWNNAFKHKHYGPYPGHASAKHFKALRDEDKQKFFLFEDDLKGGLGL